MATLASSDDARLDLRRARFIATIFLGSFLLFLVQPMIARLALPRLGGAPSVWNSAMIVYQALLLAGYLYAHWLGRFAPRRQAAIHLAVFVVAAVTLPIGLIAATPSPEANPFLWVPWLLAVSIGPLFFVVSAQAPLIQRWYSLTTEENPYPLYAASNLGSFAGLIVYPFAVEPLLTVFQQRWLWSVGYALLGLLLLWSALSLRPARATAGTEPGFGSIPGRSVALWILLAAVPSGLILSTTLHLTTDVVAMPLLWVVPLGTYLLSFVVAFSAYRTPARVIRSAAPFMLLVAIGTMSAGRRGFDLLFAAVAVVNFFTLSVAIHSELFERRPEPRQLTLFYVALSLGGVLGGIFCGLVAPMIFDWTYEHLLLLILAALLMSVRSPFARYIDLWDGSSTVRAVTLVGVGLVAFIAAASHLFGTHAVYIAFLALLAIAIFAIGNRILFAAAVAALLVTGVAWDKLVLSATPGKMTRSFFGIYSIESGPGHSRQLVHGTTVHGAQNLGSPERERMPTTYYVPDSGVGLAMAAAPALFGGDARIDVVGLGTGTLACYARPGQAWTFYEIDPAVVRIARQSFSFVPRCLPDARIVLGDARLSLARAAPQGADILVVDAFSSDSIPMHLLTREAFANYRRRLAPDGLLLVHISNRHLNLEPVLAGVAANGGWQAMLREYHADRKLAEQNYNGSVWVALSADAQMLARLKAFKAATWRPLRLGECPIVWTDEYSSLLPIVQWRS